MDAVLNNLRAILCPEGDNCTRPACPLQHNRDKRAAGSPGLDGTDERDLNDDGPRKRRKMLVEVEQPKPAITEVATAKRPVSPPPLKRDFRASVHSTPMPSSASPTPYHQTPRTATPPHTFTPTRSGSGATRLIPASTPTPVPTVATRASPATPAPAQAPAQAPTPAPRKPESLNPRHLRSAAPAPHDFRYKALKMLHDQYVRLNGELKKDAKDEEKKLVLSPQTLIWMALDEEEKMATDKPSVYQNIIKHRIMHYKRMTPGQWRDERLAELKKKEAAAPKRLAPKLAPGQPREINTGLTAQQEVAMLSHLLTPITDLSKYNYVSTAPSDEAIAKARAGHEASQGWEQCDRCQSRFQVFPGRREEDGALTTGGKCTYHWGKLYFPERAASNSIVKKKFKCCGQSVGQSSGCITGDSHVFKTSSPARLAALIPFVETPPNPSVPKDRAVCFDCEMGYTAHGLELLRLTATSWPDGKELLDVLVYPVGEIIDLNSRYSGVWPEDLVNAVPWTEGFKPDPETTEPPTTNNDKTEADDSKEEDGRIVKKQPRQPPKKKRLPVVSSPVAARDLLFRLIAPETPLIGHGLENDLNALRVVHPTIVDTILLYPHPRGLPIRYGLKMLMLNQLNRHVQVETEPDKDGRVLGHDSAEDARAAGELVRWKVQNRWREMQKKGWKLGEDGGLVPPEVEGEKGEGGNGKGKGKEGSGSGNTVGIGGLLTEGFLEDDWAK